MNLGRAGKTGRRLVGGGIARMRRISSAERTPDADGQLGVVLAFVAGAVNAGGFLVLGQYTSHMSGIVSSMADGIALGTLGTVGAGLSALAAFVLGAACSAILINWGRRRNMAGRYALPLMLEAALLVGFGLAGIAPGTLPHAGAAVGLLCFVMGLQNATITKASGARIRTTHVTGMVTDLGIELGKMLYPNRDGSLPAVRADMGKARLLLAMLAGFAAGGVAGAMGFLRLGAAACLPLAGILLVLSLPVALSGRPGFWRSDGSGSAG